MTIKRYQFLPSLLIPSIYSLILSHTPYNPHPYNKLITIRMSAYTPSQLTQYLTHVSLLPPQPQPQPPTPSPSLTYLKSLHTHQISTIPYENLVLHYSTNRKIDLNPQVLFEKFVSGGDDARTGAGAGGRGRGGYCMENSIFFNHVLRGLGFRAYLAGARIRLRGSDGVPRGGFTGW
jgi:arylamine N-acetyltransferase